MKHIVELIIRIVLLVFIFFIWIWVLNEPFSYIMNLCIIAGGELLVFPAIWIARKILDRKPTSSRAVWITTFVHYTLGILFGLPIISAITTHQDWSCWTLPIPVEIGLILLIMTGAVLLLTMVNLALRGFGAPF